MSRERRGTATTSSCASTRGSRRGPRKRRRSSSCSSSSSRRSFARATEGLAMAGDPFQRYTEATAEGQRLVLHGEFRTSLERFQDAYAAAAELEDQQLIFRSLCNLSTARLSLGEIREAEKGLREILLKTEDPQCIFVASSNLASSLRRQGRLEKALFYAQHALRGGVLPGSQLRLHAAQGVQARRGVRPEGHGHRRRQGLQGHRQELLLPARRDLSVDGKRGRERSLLRQAAGALSPPRDPEGLPAHVRRQQHHQPEEPVLGETA